MHTHTYARKTNKHSRTHTHIHTQTRTYKTKHTCLAYGSNIAGFRSSPMTCKAGFARSPPRCCWLKSIKYLKFGPVPTPRSSTRQGSVVADAGCSARPAKRMVRMRNVTVRTRHAASAFVVDSSIW